MLAFLVALALACHAQNPAVSVNIDVQAGRHSISPLIYGVNLFEDPNTAATLQDLNAPLNRYGGNRASSYNWNVNSDNRGNDNFFESISDNVATAGGRGDTFITQTKTAGTEPMVTIPMLDWIAQPGPANPFPCSYPKATFPMQFLFDMFEPNCGDGLLPDGVTLINGADPNVALSPNSVATQQAWVQHIIGNFSPAANGGLKYYILDNEHDLWWETHHDAVPQGPHYNEDRDKMFQYASMVKTQDPNALVVGPEVSGWLGYLLTPYDFEYGKLNGFGDLSMLPDRVALNGVDYMPWLLGQFQQYETNNHQRILDVFTVHYYPQGGNNNQNTRSLWDPTYIDPSYINDKIMLIPRMKQWVANNYPGTRIGITEYNWGNINNEAMFDNMGYAVTQADVLGIFGREGLDLATRFNAPPVGLPTYNAMKMYRNYDGNKSTFGDTSLLTTVPNPDNVAAFAAQRTADGAITITILNKYAAGNTPATVSLANFNYTGPAQVWQLSGNGMAIKRLADTVVNNSTFSLTLPLQSITLVVVPSVKADFTLNVTTPVLTTFAGQIASFGGTLATASGYNNVVNISCGVGHPQTCSSTAVTPSAGGQAYSIMTSDPTPSDYNFNIIATGTDAGSTTHQQAVTFHVVDFNISQPNPSSVMVGQGNSTPNINFSALGFGGFSSSIAFSCTGLPAGASCVFTPANASPTANSPVPVALVIQSGNAAPGTYPVNIVAHTTGAPADKMQTLSLTIAAAAPPTDLALTVSKSLTFGSGSAFPVAFTFTVQNLGMGSSVAATLSLGFSAPVQIGVLPVGCATPTLNSVACNFISTNGTPAQFVFPVNAAFSQPVSVNAVLTSTAADTNPNNDNASSTASMPPRPFFRRPTSRFP